MSASSIIDNATTIDTIISILEGSEYSGPFDWVTEYFINNTIEDLNDDQLALMNEVHTKVFNDNNVVAYARFSTMDMVPFGLREIDDEAAAAIAWQEFVNKLIAKGGAIIGWSLRYFREDEFEHLWYPHIDILLDVPNYNLNVRVLGSAIRIIAKMPQDRNVNLSNFVRNAWSNFLARTAPGGNLYELVAILLEVLTPESFLDEAVWTEHAVRNLIIETIENSLRGQINHRNPTKTYCQGSGLAFHEVSRLLD